jgi:Ca2+-binding RTX toxin-like protein
MLRNGGDSLSVCEVTNPDAITQTCMFNGGNDVDTISFAQFTHSVNIDLGNSNAVDTGHGKFIVVNFENLIGGSGDDRLEAQGDGGRLTGGSGADTFVFANGDGDITVTDFSIGGGDKIDLSGLTGVTDFADLSAHHMSQNGANTEITSGNGDVLVLENVTKGDLSSAQFEF